MPIVRPLACDPGQSPNQGQSPDISSSIAGEAQPRRTSGGIAESSITTSASERIATCPSEPIGTSLSERNQTSLSKGFFKPTRLDTVVGQAAVITAPAKFELKRTEFRVPVADEVRVKLEGCGVCASNIPVWEGRPWFQYPLEAGAPGHEAWGRVDAIGPEVESVAPGDRVALLSSHGYAEYDICPTSELVRIPEAFDAIDFPGEPLGCAMNIFQRSAIRIGETVAIVGIGFLGALLTQLAANAGAKVFAISRRPEPLATAKRFGASEVIQSGDADRVKKLVLEATEGCGCDCVIEAVGNQAALDLATELTAERGRLVIAGYHQDGPRTVNMQLWNWRGLDVINAHERDPAVYVRGMKEALGAITRGLMNPQPLYTHYFALDQLGDAFKAITERPGDFMKGLLIL